jgi:hypothetical protein
MSDVTLGVGGAARFSWVCGSHEYIMITSRMISTRLTNGLRRRLSINALMPAFMVPFLTFRQISYIGGVIYPDLLHLSR